MRALRGWRKGCDDGYQLWTGKATSQPGLRAKEQGEFEGRYVQSGDAGAGAEVGQAAPLPGVSLMEPSRKLRRQEWLL